MTLRARGRLWVPLAATAALLVPLGWLWQQSLVPETYDLAAMGVADWGGGPVDEPAGQHGTMKGMPGTAVADLTAPPDAPADVRVTLTVRAEGDGYTVNGTSPGPLIEAVVGDLVEVTLVNDNLNDGTTLHWHGVDVPNAADGVAGVTQDAVLPGERFVYRFVADQAGTFWYHSHQISHAQVQGGLFGGLVIHPAGRDVAVLDQVALVHRYDSGPTLNGRLGTTTVDAEPGQEIRLRLVNTDNGLTSAWVTGTSFRVLAVDGTDLHEPDLVEGEAVRIPAGGRVDLGFVVPESGARVDLGATALVFGRDPAGTKPRKPEQVVDLLSYGEPTDLPFDPTDPDRSFEYVIGKRPGFLDGRPGLWWTINGRLYPDVPMFMVAEGDLVVFTIENNSDDTHPMHLHGHHAVVLAKDGVAATGSPWWVDSLEVAVGESYEIAFVADNPGLWMDHCHNLTHAAEGLVAHLMYTGVTSSYRIGGPSANQPE